MAIHKGVKTLGGNIESTPTDVMAFDLLLLWDDYKSFCWILLQIYLICSYTHISVRHYMHILTG